MDYAESLGYWYLRLNGFFPITNFVLHQPKGEGQSTDCDVLAVRLPHVAETISNDPANVVRWDEDFFKKFDIDLAKDTLGVITSVKSGGYSVKEVEEWFDTERLFYSVHRIGLVPQAEVDAVVAVLKGSPLARRGNTVILKLLVDTETHRRKAEANRKKRKGAWLQITLEEIDAFIKDRFNNYKKHKSGARMYFHDSLIQYLAWQCNLGGEDEEEQDD